MTSKQTSLIFRVGVFTALTVAAFMVGVFAIGNRKDYFQKKYSLWTTFDGVEGLVPGAPVRLGGVEVGLVSNIAFKAQKPRPVVKIEMSLEQKVADRIRKDSVATIETMGLMGEKYVSISLGSEDSPILEANSYLAGQTPAGLSVIMAHLNKVVDNLMDSNVSEKLVRMVDQYSSVGSDINRILIKTAEGKGILGQLTSADSKYSNLLGDLSASMKNLNGTLNSLNTIANNVSNGQGTLGKFVTDDHLYDSLNGTLRNINEITASINKGEGTIGLLLKDKATGQNLMDDLTKVAKTLSSFADKLENGEGLVPSLINDPKSKEILVNLRKAMDSLNDIMRQVNSGQGTLGKFVYDNKVYDDLATILAGGKNSTLVKWFAGSNHERGERAQAEDAANKPTAPTYFGTPAPAGGK